MLETTSVAGREDVELAQIAEVEGAIVLVLDAQAIAIESAESKDTDVIEVLDFGEGFVLVEAVGAGTTKVIAEGDGRRVKIKYEVSEDSAGELRVEELELGLAAP